MSTNTNILGALSSFIVRDSAGSVQWDRTLSAIRGQIEAELLASAETDSKVEGVVDSLFDQVPAGTGVPRPMIVQSAAAILSGGNIMAQVKAAADVESFLDRSPRFVAKRGRSGGLFRVG